MIWIVELMMGKQTGKKNKQLAAKSGESSGKESRAGENSPKVYDKDTAVFISMSRELKDEGNKLFQKRDYEGAMLKYEKAIKLLPRNHIDVSYLRSNMAESHMQMGLGEYPRAIHECNLALEVTPKYSKALLKRSRCYEALNRLDFAMRDVDTVLKMEPNNIMATEIAERVRTIIEKKGIKTNDVPIDLVAEYVEPPCASPAPKVMREKPRKKKGKIVDKVEEENVEKETDEKIVEEKVEGKNGDERTQEKNDEESVEEKKAEDKLVVEEKISNIIGEEPTRNVKLVFGEDIRWAQLPFNCSILKLREVIRDRFPSLNAVLIKYRDPEGDLVTVTTNEELRWAEASAEQHGSLRLYIVEVNPDQDPFYEKVCTKHISLNGGGIMGNGKHTEMRPSCIDDWIIQFAQIFKNYVGFNSDAYLDLHELGMKLYSEAMEETVTSEEAQNLFHTAAEKFQEMAALALFNCGNVHMSSARKRVYFSEDASRKSILAQVETAYDWAQKEYSEAGKKYEEALRIKPNFYEGVLALGQQQFEQAKLSWYYAVGTNVDLENWPSTEEVLQLYNNAEDNMERGMQMWEEAEVLRLNELSKTNKVKTLIQDFGLEGLCKDVSAEEAAEQAANMSSQINVLWGTMLYERSIMEFKLGLPVWQECLEVAVEKFELAGASPTDIAVMVKNHCSNNSAVEGNIHIYDTSLWVAFPKCPDL